MPQNRAESAKRAPWVTGGRFSQSQFLTLLKQTRRDSAEAADYLRPRAFMSPPLRNAESLHALVARMWDVEGCSSSSARLKSGWGCSRLRARMDYSGSWSTPALPLPHGAIRRPCR